MTADRPLTRRELRALERAREAAPEQPAPEPGPEQPAPWPASEQPVPEPAPEQPAPEPPAAAPLTRLSSRRALREVARDLETTSERAAVRRRPVQAPTTTGITVVDAATGAISAVPFVASQEQPAAPPAPVPEPTVVPEPAPMPESESDTRLRRRSVLGRGADSVVASPEPAPETAEEDVEEEARRSALATILRFLVMLVAAFVIGALIWTLADDSAEARVVASQATRGAP